MMSSIAPDNSRMRTKPSGSLHVGNFAAGSRRDASIAAECAEGNPRVDDARRERDPLSAARAGLNGRLWIPGISGLRRCKASGRDGPVTRTQLVCHRSGGHAGKEQSTECKLAAQPCDAPPIGGTRAPDVSRRLSLTTHIPRDLHTGRAVRVALESAFRRSGNRFAAESASNVRNLERFLIPTNLKPL
jgi:hypothetical protein